MPHNKFEKQYYAIAAALSNVVKGGIMNVLLKIAEILVLIGALNWGLVGLFRTDLVEKLFGEMSPLAKIIYILIGISAILLIFAKFIPAT